MTATRASGGKGWEALRWEGGDSAHRRGRSPATLSRPRGPCGRACGCTHPLPARGLSARPTRPLRREARRTRRRASAGCSALRAGAERWPGSRTPAQSGKGGGGWRQASPSRVVLRQRSAGGCRAGLRPPRELRRRGSPRLGGYRAPSGTGPGRRDSPLAGEDAGLPPKVGPGGRAVAEDWRVKDRSGSRAKRDRN